MAHNTKLKTGKAVGAFDDFVDTFNYLVSFCNNLKGEGEEVDGSDGGLRVDRTVETRPVLRGGGGVSTSASESFRLVSDIQYNTTSHAIEKKYVTVTVASGKITSISAPSSWTEISGGQADPLYAS